MQLRKYHWNIFEVLHYNMNIIISERRLITKMLINVIHFSRFSVYIALVRTNAR